MSLSYPFSPSLWHKVDSRIVRSSDDECWLWTGDVSSTGYGQITHQENRARKTLTAHRLMLARKLGAAIPPGKYVLHRCDVPRCCNPAHLSLGTQSDNLKDCVAKGRHHDARKTHCIHGHPFDADNTSRRTRPGGGRACRECIRIRQRQAYHARKCQPTSLREQENG